MFPGKQERSYLNKSFKSGSFSVDHVEALANVFEISSSPEQNLSSAAQTVCTDILFFVYIHLFFSVFERRTQISKHKYREIIAPGGKFLRSLLELTPTKESWYQIKERPTIGVRYSGYMNVFSGSCSYLLKSPELLPV